MGERLVVHRRDGCGYCWVERRLRAAGRPDVPHGPRRGAVADTFGVAGEYPVAPHDRMFPAIRAAPGRTDTDGEAGEDPVA